MGNSCSTRTSRRKSTRSAKTQREQRTQVLKVAASDLGRKPGVHVESQRASAPGKSSELDLGSVS